GKYEVVDALKTAYKLDISLYYGDTRVLTTITDENGRRLVGEQAPQQAVYWALERNREFFVKSIQIGARYYYGYYIPMLSRDGSVVGMAFAGRPVEEVHRVMRNAVAKALVISLLAIVITLLVCLNANRHITTALHAIQKYLGLLAGGNFDMQMPVSVSRREDEIGDMGRYAVEVCDALEKKITTDPLTGLLNRRACNQQLEKMLAHVNRDETARMTVTIGDIDYFKSVNDTYGHECGDIVLKTVSDILAEGMKDKGIVARWGGEEFLVVYSCHIDDMLEDLNEMVWRIRSYKFDYEGFEPFYITMSFGVNGRVWDKTQDEVIKEADECLYYGKETGRNKIVCTDGRVLLPDGTFSTIAAEINKAQKESADEGEESGEGDEDCE
ncbi:MAG: diguanylate cyclase, partial [Lachnospiraceae bacterium]|nr:diguanylate cyclase [Lachnospiraceae bacterium]